MDFSDVPEELTSMMTALMERLQVRDVEQRVAILESKTDFIADRAWLCWKKGDLRFFLCESAVYREGLRLQQEQPDLYEQLSIYKEVGRFCGYVRFPSLPLIAPGYRGIATYVPVHGDITFFQDWWDGSVTYGFDTAHLVSQENIEIVSDVDWMMAETESMARGIQIAARFEPYYLRATTNARKAVVLERMAKFLPFELHGHMGAMLNLLGGEL